MGPSWTRPECYMAISPTLLGLSTTSMVPRKSGYGATRVMELKKLGMEMRVTVTRVHVVPTADSARTPEYKFHDLTLEITTRSL